MRRRASLLCVVFLLIILIPAFFLESGYTANASSPLFWRLWGGKGDDVGSSVAVDFSDNILVTGSTTSFSVSGLRVFLLKYDSLGNLLWQRIWNESASGESIAVDSAGNIYLAGLDNGAFLLKLNQTGNPVWQKRWGNSSVVNDALALSGSGDPYLTGTMRYNTTASDLFLVRFDSSGATMWQKTWGMNCASTGHSMVVDITGKIYVTGYRTCQDSVRAPDGVLLKFDSTGTLEWQKNWTGVMMETIATDPSANIYVGGSTICLDFQGYYATFAKFNSNGTGLWKVDFDYGPKGPRANPCDQDHIAGVVTDNAGNLFATGSDGNGVMLNKLDTNGNPIRSDSTGYGSGLSIAIDSSGTPVLTGYLWALPFPQWFHYGNGSCKCPGISLTPISGKLVNSDYPTANLTGFFSNVKGNTTYGGGRDVLLNYGSGLPVFTFNPIIGALIIGTAMVAVRIGRIGRRRG